MPQGIFRLRMSDGTTRLAVGDVARGPSSMIPASFSLDALLADGGPALDDAIAAASEPVPAGAEPLAPAEAQEIWAAGVTYLRSRDARIEESIEPSPYDRVYDAERPELFHKAPGWRAVGDGAPIGVRSDSAWNVPEPELALVLDASMGVAGYTIGNDVSSRTIEGENTLYLPQAKSYDRSCALGPALVPVSEVSPPFEIRMAIERSGETVSDDATSTDTMARSFEDLTSHLGSALTFPVGVVLLTGTGIVPDPPFTLLPGDHVRITVDGLGTLANPVVGVGPE